MYPSYASNKFNKFKVDRYSARFFKMPCFYHQRVCVCVLACVSVCKFWKSIRPTKVELSSISWSTLQRDYLMLVVDRGGGCVYIPRYIYLKIL